jgi:hypothetical protein
MSYVSCSLDDPVTWAYRNGYAVTKIEWPLFSTKHASGSNGASLINASVDEDDRRGISDGLILINAENCRLIDYTFPNGQKLYLLLGRSDNIFCPTREQRWYQLSQNIGFFGLSKTPNEIDVSFKDMPRIPIGQKEVNYVLGHPNHGHWLQDALPAAIVLDSINKKPCIVRPLDTWKRDSLSFAGITGLELPTGTPGGIVHEFEKLNVISPLPPSLVPDVLRYRYSSVVAQFDKSFFNGSYFLNKRIGNIRLVNAHHISTELDGLNIRAIDPSAIPFKESLLLFSFGKTFITPIGAEMTNLFFGSSRNIVITMNLETFFGYLPFSLFQPIAMVRGSVVEATSVGTLPTPDSARFEVSTAGMADLLTKAKVAIMS